MKTQHQQVKSGLARLLLALALFLPWTAARADGLSLRAGLGNHLPRITAPINAATRRINRALDAADEDFDELTANCQPHPDVSRKIAVTARVPALLSIVATDLTYCGGAYPNTGTLALVFDLKSGRSVDRTRLLPSGAVAAHSDEAEAVRGIIAWASLRRAYLARYRAAPAVAAAVGHDNIEPCAGIVASDQDFLLWPDTRARALMAQPVGLPHVAAGCEAPVALDVAVLKALGLAPAAITTITGRQTRGQ